METNSISITDIIAIIGCITGCASLFINLYKILLEKGKIYIYSNKYFNVFFEKLPESKFLTQYQAMIYIEVINSTPHPITIYDIDIWLRDGHYSPSSCPIEKITLSQKQPGGITVISETNMKNALTTPYVIEPFQVYIGHIFLCNFLPSPKSKEPFLMTVKTTMGTKRLLGKIKKYKSEID